MDADHIVLENGVARTKNRRVKVKMIAVKAIQARESPEAIAEHYGITLADVYAALAYYYDNRPAFDALEQENEEAGQRYGVQAEEHIAKMRAKPIQNPEK